MFVPKLASCPVKVTLAVLMILLANLLPMNTFSTAMFS